MKILFIGSRLYDDVDWYVKEKGIESVLTESNEEAINLDLPDQVFIVPRGMDGPKQVALMQNVDAIIPLIGIDPPLIDVAHMKEEVEKEHGIPVIAADVRSVELTSNKIKTKEFYNDIGVVTPNYQILTSPDELTLDFPVVLKQGEGQGGKDICITSDYGDVVSYFENFNQSLVENFIEGAEVSIEVVGWNGEYLPLVPVYKGDTNLEGIHPIKRLRYGPCDFEGISNEQFRQLAKKIAVNLKSEGTIDMDLIYSREENKVYAIEINTRPSGTRYLSYACSDLNPLNLLVDIAIGDFDVGALEEKMKHYCCLEIPIGNYHGPAPQEPLKEYVNGNFIVHGPEGYQRITIRGKTREETLKIAKELTGNDYSIGE
jgi:carbamoylphosphate synthase large subunit